MNISSLRDGFDRRRRKHILNSKVSMTKKSAHERWGRYTSPPSYWRYQINLTYWYILVFPLRSRHNKGPALFIYLFLTALHPKVFQNSFVFCFLVFWAKSGFFFTSHSISLIRTLYFPDTGFYRHFCFVHCLVWLLSSKDSPLKPLPNVR